MILYINGNYPHHSLHSELVFKLAELGNEITVFVPMKGKELEGKYRCNHPKVKVIYCDCLKTTDRVFFINKIHRIIKEIEKQVALKEVDCILAGTVYSDGAAAYLLYKRHRIPFSVAVRQTDVISQMKWRPYLNRFIKHLLEKANKVVFISPAHRAILDKLGPDRRKYVIIPNAVNDYWFKESKNKRTIHDPISLIYVGEITKLKNVNTTISVLAVLNKRNIQTELHIVGSGAEEGNCRVLAKKLGVEQQVFFHGWQYGKEKIKAYYDQADIFVMPSHRETFGTVYIEALSQGLPVIYTKGQGIDGYFEEGSVGYGCDPVDVDEIADKIIEIKDDYTRMSRRSLAESAKFRWEIVAGQYNDIIQSMRKA